MMYSESGQQAQGKKSGQKLSKAEAGRRAFHRQQIQNPEILMPDLDPDEPVLLGKLQRFDELICTRLRMLGYPGTGNGDRPPKSCRPMVLARKLAGKSQSISQADIAVLADRIGWLQRNCFRWSVRNGYAEYFARRDAKPSSEMSENINEGAASDAASSEVQNALSEAKESKHEPPIAAFEDGFANIKLLVEPVVAGPSTSASQSSFSASERTPVLATGSASDELVSAESSDGSQWPSWAAEIRRRRPEQVPQMPERPRTYALDFPVSKAKALLYTVAKQHPIAEQITKARSLLEDRAELYQALTHGDQVREDLINVFASLGLEL